MTKLRIISFRIPDETVARLDLLAKAADRDRSWLLNEAVEFYLNEHRETAGKVKAKDKVKEKPAAHKHEKPADEKKFDPAIDFQLPERAAEEKTDHAAQAIPGLIERPLSPTALDIFAPPAPPGAMAKAASHKHSAPKKAAPKTHEPAHGPSHPSPGAAPAGLHPPSGFMAGNAFLNANLPEPTSSRRPVRGKLLAFLTAKGGSGVTTLACNFAVSLTMESRQKVMLIDLNLPLGDAAINLGIKPHFSTTNALRNAGRLDSIFLGTLLEQHKSGLFVLAAPSELSPTEFTLEAIDRLLNVAREDFDYVVVDAGSRLDLQHMTSFDESANIYLVTQVGVPELRNSNRLITEFPSIGGPQVEIVINRFDPRAQDISEDQITKALTKPARWRIPNDYAAVRQMQNSANPLVLGSSPISRTVQQMARYVCGRPEPPEEQKGVSFFRWKVSRA